MEQWPGRAGHSVGPSTATAVVPIQNLHAVRCGRQEEENMDVARQVPGPVRSVALRAASSATLLAVVVTVVGAGRKFVG